MIITGASNQVVKRLRSLRDRKQRLESGAFLVEGSVMISEALKCGLTPFEALCETEDDAYFALKSAGANVYIAERSAIDSACDTKTPQGVCCSFALPSEKSVSDGDRRVIALDRIQDPGNAGTIWRTADAAGFDFALFSDGCADMYSPKVQRASMGSGFRVPAKSCDLISELIALKSRGYAVVAAALGGFDIYSRRQSFEKFALVIGNEAHGISDDILRIADMKIQIPMRGGAESLNAAVAAGVLMYELTRPLNPTP